jgi:hypothetical protein
VNAEKLARGLSRGSTLDESQVVRRHLSDLSFSLSGAGCTTKVQYSRGAGDGRLKELPSSQQTKSGTAKDLRRYTMARPRRQARRRSIRKARRVSRSATRQSRRTGRRVARRVRRVGRKVARNARRPARKGAHRVRRAGRKIGRAKRIITRAAAPRPGEEPELEQESCRIIRHLGSAIISGLPSVIM